MNPRDALNAVKQLSEQLNGSLECLKTNRQEAVNLLIDELKDIVDSIIGGTEVHDKSIPYILYFIGELEVKEAFCHLNNILKNNKTEGIDYNPFVNALSKCVSSDDINTLKEYIFKDTYDGKTRFASYLAIKTLLCTNKRTDSVYSDEPFPSFIFELINLQPRLDALSNHKLLFDIFNECYESHSSKLRSEMKMLLIKLIANDKMGSNSNCIKDYFRWLYQLDPAMSYTIQEIKGHILGYKKEIHDGIFAYFDFKNIGKHLFHKTVSDLESATPDMVKLALKELNRYPYVKRPVPFDDEGYFTEIRINAGIIQLPRDIFKRAEKLYDEVFIKDFTELSSLITKRREAIIKKKQYIEKKSENIVSKCSNNGSKIAFDIRPCISELDNIEIKLKRYEAELELMTFYEEQIEKTKSIFCEGYKDPVMVERKLKELSQLCYSVEANPPENKSADNQYIYKPRILEIDDYFTPYKRAVKQISALIGSESDSDSIDLIFYKIIFLPFLKELENEAIATKMDTEAYKKKVSDHQLNSINLVAVSKDIEKYMRLLEENVEKTVLNIRHTLEKSIALLDRKVLIEKGIKLFLDNENELFVNFISIQIEGMFSDLLRSIPYGLFSNFNLYHDETLRHKIDILQSKDVNKFFEVEAYFKYFFSKVIRNTIAHGRHSLLLNNGFDIRKMALELLFCLNYFTDAIYKINELDAMNEYINGAISLYGDIVANETNLEDFYDCLLSDLNGKREPLRQSEYKPGLFKSYDPVQIIWWIFNPYYENYCTSKENLSKVRDIVLSTEFWCYVKEKLESSYFSLNYDNTKFKVVITHMLVLSRNKGETKNILNEIIRII